MTALVPANPAEYLAEIADDRLRDRVIRYLPRERVLPELMGGPAGTALGLNIEWKLGRYIRRACNPTSHDGKGDPRRASREDRAYHGCQQGHRI